MAKVDNPHPQTIIDEHSGVAVANIAHKIWEEGFTAGQKSRKNP